jgi:probable HAF family extracellular repeat protein
MVTVTSPPPPPPPTPTPPPPAPPPPTPPSLPQSWTATDLPPVQGAGASQANALNNLGNVVGYFVENGVAHATLWEDGTTIDLGSNSFANDINEFGQIVGYYLSDSGIAHAFTWPNQVDLGTLPGFDSSIAPGVNNSGIIVGVSFSSADPNQQGAFSWTIAGGMQPVAGCASAEAINDSGQIVGIALDLDAAICGGQDFAQTGAAVAINTSGQTVGHAANDAWLFPNTNLGPTLATGINDNGWVVGYQVTPQGAAQKVQSHIARLRPRVVGTSQPWIWTEQTGIVMLPSLVTANAINKPGQIVGDYVAADGSTHGMLLTGN